MKQAYVQISRSSPGEANRPGIVNVNQLVDAIRLHPDLESIEESRRVECLVSLFVFTGCDFVSFFNGISKTTFLKNLHQEAHFICGTTGHTLADWDVPIRSSSAEMLKAVTKAETSKGALAAPPELQPVWGAFLRNIGVGYYLRYKARLDEATAPRSFTKTTGGGDLLSSTALEAWLDGLRDATWTASAGEEGNVPSIGALFFHFMRAVLVLRIWNTACEVWVAAFKVECFGYRKSEGTGQLELVYDFSRQIKLV